MCTLLKEILHWLWRWSLSPLYLFVLTLLIASSFKMIYLSLLTILQYQNCLRKFFYNTDSQVLLYLSRTHYEAEQWQDSKRALLRAIHLSPSNYTLRFNLGVVMQKFSASLLNKEKRSADEVISWIYKLCSCRCLVSWISQTSIVLFEPMNPDICFYDVWFMFVFPVPTLFFII